MAGIVKAIVVTEKNTNSVEALTGLKSFHIIGKVIVVIENGKKLSLVEVCQKWAFNSKYAFVEPPAENNLTPVVGVKF